MPSSTIDQIDAAYRNASRSRRLALPTLAVGVAILTAGVGACGDTATQSLVIVRVGQTPITRQELTERMSAMAPGHIVPDPPRYSACVAYEQAHGQQPIGNALAEECAAQYASLRTRALRYLISTDWLVAEARAHNQAPSIRDVEAWLATNPGQAAPSARTRRMTAERALAAGTIQHEIRSKEAPISHDQVVRFYVRHISRFERRERRYLDITENLRGRARALAVLDALKTHRRPGVVAIREYYDRPRADEPVPSSKELVLKAIFSAKRGVYIGPLRLNGYYAIFRITRIVPRLLQRLEPVEGTIRNELSEAQHKRTLARFLKAWSARWKVVTSCKAAYSVPECRSSGAGTSSEDAAAAGLG